MKSTSHNHAYVILIENEHDVGRELRLTEGIYLIEVEDDIVLNIECKKREQQRQAENPNNG